MYKGEEGERAVEICNKSMIGCFLDLMQDTCGPTICGTMRSLIKLF